MSMFGAAATVKADQEDSALIYEIPYAIKQVAEELLLKAKYEGSRPKYHTFHLNIRIDPMRFTYCIEGRMENELTGFTIEELKKTEAEVKRLLEEAEAAREHDQTD